MTKFVESRPNFPFEQMYRGQQEAYDKLVGFQQSAITSPTGSGKTALYLGVTRGESTIIISPRKFLQLQISTYNKDTILYGKSEYHCPLSPTGKASQAPCNVKIECDKTSVPEECKSQQNCNKTACKLFTSKKNLIKFPCEGWEYIAAQMRAKRTLQNKGTVIANFGNFWTLLPMAKVVVIDEADLFFREMSKATRLAYSKRNDVDDSILTLLDREEKGLADAIKKSAPSAAYTLQNKMYDIQFLKMHNELCFKYQRKDKIYIEVSPVNTNVLKDKIFKNKRLLIVSATLGEFNIPVHSDKVWQRRGTYFCPVGKLTSKNLKENPWIMGVAAERIETISGIAEGMFDTKKFPVHTGNLGTSAYALNNHLGPDRKSLFCNICGEQITDISPEEQEVKCPKCNRKWVAKEDLCTLHKSGNLMETIEVFKENDKRYLLVAGADYGADLPFKVQFLLKFPYASLDERMRVLERVMGKQKFNEYYINEAITRTVQACGRVCRGAGDFGVTIILDSKFADVYGSYRNRFPQWFKDSFDEKCY